MKVNLLLDNPGDVRSGYLNIDPFTPDECTDGRIKGDVTNLNEHVEAGEAKEIVAVDIISYWPASKVDDTIAHYISKLAHGGKLVIAFTDMKEVARGILSGKLSLEEANIILHGHQERGWDQKRSSYQIDIVAEAIRDLGMNILQKRVRNFMAYVTAVRP